MLGQLVEHARQHCVLDMEASLEHMSRGTVRHVDVLFVVLEPYYRSLETAGRTVPLARELGIEHVFGLANKVRDEHDTAAVAEYCERHGLSLAATIPFDKAITAADRTGMAVVDYDSAAPAVRQIDGLVDWLQETF
jgi:CO dehydrogenase maturation factor